MADHDVIIVGAGLAGLTAAVELAGAGRRPLVLEAAKAVGGRVRTDEIEGFRLDRGFQVLLTAYPEARRVLDLAALDLRLYEPGARLALGGRLQLLADPWRRPLEGLGTVIRGVVSPGDGLRLARLRSRVRRQPVARLLAGTGRSTRERLEREGFSASLVRRFLRPFLAGVFLDPELETADGHLDFVYSMFAAGDAAVPARGMGEIPAQLASRLPADGVRTGVEVVEVRPDRVRTASGETLTAAAVVVATDAPAAHRLAGVPVSPPTGRHVTCVYFDAPTPPVRGPRLVLDGEGHGPVTNLVVASEVSRDLAPPGRALVSASVLGEAAALDDDDLEARVRAQLGRWFGDEVGGWRRLAVYRIPFALPDQRPSVHWPKEGFVRREDGLIVCGDHTADGSINGAMHAGAAAARALLSRA